MASYKVERVPLDAPLDRMEVVPRGMPVRYITVDQLTDGAEASIHVGTADPIVLQHGKLFDSCPAETDGIYVSSTVAQPGAVAVLIVGTLNVSGGV